MGLGLGFGLGFESGLGFKFGFGLGSRLGLGFEAGFGFECGCVTSARETEGIAERQVVRVVGPVGGAQCEGAVELIPGARHHLERAPPGRHVHQDRLLRERGARARGRVVRRGEGEGVAARAAGAATRQHAR